MKFNKEGMTVKETTMNVCHLDTNSKFKAEKWGSYLEKRGIKYSLVMVKNGGKRHYTFRIFNSAPYILELWNFLMDEERN